LNQAARITPLRMVILGAGLFGFDFFWGFHSASMPLFLKNFSDSKFHIALVLSLAGVAGCIISPIIGYISDRTSGRFGRRRPYILLGIVGASACIWGLPHARTFGALVLYSAAMYSLVIFAETPYWSLLPDITPQRQRSTASGVMNLMGSLGLIAFFLIGWKIWESNPLAVFRAVAIVCFVSVLVTIVLIREPERPSGKPPSMTGIASYLRSVAKEADAVKFYIVQFFLWLGLMIVVPFNTLFVVEELGASEGDSLLVPMAFSIVSTIFVLPLGMLGDRIGRRGILSFMIALWAVAEIVVMFSQNLTHALITIDYRCRLRIFSRPHSEGAHCRVRGAQFHKHRFAPDDRAACRGGADRHARLSLDISGRGGLSHRGVYHASIRSPARAGWRGRRDCRHRVKSARNIGSFPTPVGKTVNARLGVCEML